MRSVHARERTLIYFRYLLAVLAPYKGPRNFVILVETSFHAATVPFAPTTHPKLPNRRTIPSVISNRKLLARRLLTF
jgi:hypothetical protein